MQLCGIGKALATYAVKYGSYPYSAAGEGSSLYLLKDLVPATIFEIPDHPDPTGHPHYDDSVRKLECSGYRYLNKPLSWTTEPDANSICVIAVERADLTGGRINALFSDGHEEFVGGDISWALLGRTYKELKNSAGNN